MNSIHKREPLGVVRVKPSLRGNRGKVKIRKDSPDRKDRHQNRLVSVFKTLGPGLITGASDDDPAGIVTYAVAGATLGFSILWTALVTLPLMLAMQTISARIGLVRGHGIASVLKEAYGHRWLLYPAAALVLIANTVNLGADIGAIAQAIQLETGVPSIWLVVPVTVAIVVTLTFGSYRIISTIFKWLTLPLLAYIAAAFLSHPSVSGVIHGTFVPRFSFSRTYITTLVAIMGTTITPYLWFWQADQEVEESKGKPQREREAKPALKRSIWDVSTGILFSTVVMYAVVVATGATLFKSGQHHVTSSAQVASALAPAAGGLATLLFAVGIIGAGTLAVPILAGSASYAIGETFGWQVGIDRPWYRAKAFYAVIIVASLAGMTINFSSLSAVTALFYSAVINGLIAPPLMLLIMLVANNERVMGKHTNNTMLNMLGWAATAIMTLAAVAMIWTL